MEGYVAAEALRALIKVCDVGLVSRPHACSLWRGEQGMLWIAYWREPVVGRAGCLGPSRQGGCGQRCVQPIASSHLTTAFHLETRPWAPPSTTLPDSHNELQSRSQCCVQHSFLEWGFVRPLRGQSRELQPPFILSGAVPHPEMVGQCSLLGFCQHIKGK